MIESSTISVWDTRQEFFSQLNFFSTNRRLTVCLVKSVSHIPMTESNDFQDNGMRHEFCSCFALVITKKPD